MHARRTRFPGVLSLALLAGLLIGDPRSAAAQPPQSATPGDTKLATLFQPEAVPPAPNGIVSEEIAPYEDVAPGALPDDYPPPDCFAAEGESWLDWHGVPEVFEHPDEDPGYLHSYFQEHELPEEQASLGWQVWEKWIEFLELPHESLVKVSEFLTGAEHDGTFFTDPDYSWTSSVPIGVQPIMPRPPLIVETPDLFLGQGAIQEGYELPSGAIWRPTLWVFGSNRLGVSYRDDQQGPGQAGVNFGSVVNSLSLFAQLSLTGTERFQIGFRPTDEEEGRPLLEGREFQTWFWQQYTSSMGRTNLENLDALNGDVNVAYFEGQLDEIFPGLDPYDGEFLDYGFSIGRQAMSFQRGLMMNEDMIDAVTVSRNTANGEGNLNFRATGVYAWNRLTRIAPVNPNTDAQMIGLFTESDFYFNTMNFDIGFVDDPDRTHGDLLVVAVSSTQRFVGYHNTYNSRFHALASYPTEGERTRVMFDGSPGNVSGQGQLFFSQISVTPHRGEDLIYWNTFVAVDQFTSLARAPQAGPLGDNGLLFAASGLGLYGPPIATTSNSSIGTALGYQIFLDTKNQQIIYEVGARQGERDDKFEIGGAIQYQRAIAQNWIWLVTGFLTGRDGTDGLSNGLRSEIQLFF